MSSDLEALFITIGLCCVGGFTAWVIFICALGHAIGSAAKAAAAADE